jgi:peptide subunit release factor 1 (eRF1)
MIEVRWDEREMDVSCEVLDKDKVSSRQQRQHRDAATTNLTNEHSVHATSGVTAEKGNVECIDDACSRPEHTKSDDVVIDWSAFTILPEEKLDGDATVLVDEDQIYEAMGFKAADEGLAGGDAPLEIPVPEIPPEL